MAANAFDLRGEFPTDAAALVARAAAGEARQREFAKAAARDLATPATLRLNERTRAAIETLLEQIVTSIERALLQSGDLQMALGGRALTTWPLLQAAGMPDDALIEELLERVQLDLLAAALPPRAPMGFNQASLVNRFVEHPAKSIAEAARGVLLAESLARSPETGRWRMPRHLHSKLLWLVGSAMREQAGSRAGPALDQAICAAVLAELAAAEAHEESLPEAAALRFAGQVNGARAELSRLLIDALHDRRLVVFVALVAQAAEIGFADARALVVDTSGERLLLALHALQVPRDGMAQIVFMLCEADPRRDLTRLVDILDTLGASHVQPGLDMLAGLRLNQEYRSARAVLHERSAARPQ